MSKIFGWAGCLLFAVITVIVACQYGSHWRVGRDGMPATLLAPDGIHYPDGTEVDPITLAIARSGYEQEAWLAWVAFMLVMMVIIYVRMRRLYRMKMNMARRELQRCYGLPRHQ